MKTTNRVLLYCFIIVSVTAIAFSPSLNNGFTNWDDDTYVTNNPDIRGFTLHNVVKVFSSSYAASYQPLTMLTYMAEFSIFGLNPVVFHSTNLIVHIVNSLLVFLLLYLLSGNCFAGAVAALLFAVHPLRVESVAWVAERKDVLSMLFFLLSLFAYNSFLKKGLQKYYWLCMAAFVFSLLTKPIAVSQPIVLFLIDYLHDKKQNKKLLLQKTPFFVIAAVFVVITLVTQHSSGAINTISALPFFQQSCIPFYGIVFYIVKTIFPLHLSALYPFPVNPDKGLIIQFYLSFMVVLGIGIAVFYSRKFSKKVVFGALFFFVTILPLLQIVSIGNIIVAERYTYVPILGMCFIVAENLIYLQKKAFWKNGFVKTTVTAGFIVIIFIYGYITYQRCGIWKDSLSLWNDVLERHQCWLAYYNRGVAWNIKGDPVNAITDYTAAIALRPNYIDAYNNRGNAYDDIGDHDRAIEDYNQLIILKPNFAKAYFNRGLAYFAKGEIEKAVVDMEEALSLDPDYGNPANYHSRVINEIMKRRHS
jgi:hypothetical protein